MFILEKQLWSREEGNQEFEDDITRVRMPGVFGFIVVAEHPVTLDDFVGFLDFHDFNVAHLVSLAGSILVPGTDPIIESHYSIFAPLEEHKHWILALSFQPDGRRLVSGSSDRTLRIWDIQRGTCTYDPLTGHDGHVLSVCFSPDGQYIASGSIDRTIRTWDVETAVCVAGPFSGASSAVSSVTFSPDGRYLAAGSWDGAVRLWDFHALLSAGMRRAVREDKAYTGMKITDHTVVDVHQWTLGPNGEKLFWTPQPFNSVIWRPSTIRILGLPAMIKPDLSNLVTGEEWLQCFSGS